MPAAAVPPPSLQEALAHHRAGRLDAAAAAYQRVLASVPGNFDALQLAGALAIQRGRHDEAVALLRRALNQRPQAVPCLVRLATAFAALGRLAEAAPLATRAVTLDPRSVDGWQVCGGVAARQGKFAEAAAAFRKQAGIDPASPGAWVSLASALLQLHQAAEAVACCERALALEAGHPTARFFLGQALLQCNRVGDAVEVFGAHVRVRPDHHIARSYQLFALNYLDDVTPRKLWEAHRAYGLAVEGHDPAAGGCLGSGNENSPRVRTPASAQARAQLKDVVEERRKCRIGFVSPDFRQHAVASFAEPLLAGLDHARFEVVLYHDHPVVDAVSRRLASHAAAWRHCVGQPDAAVEAMIRRDRPDVLVDLAGHTGHNRLLLFARRLAPVQITYLGYPNTTGLAAMDYRFVDAITDPVGEADMLHSEKLVRWAPTAWAFAPPEGAPEPAAPPCAKGGPVTFGSFNNLSKLSAATFTLWRRLLERVSGSRLLLKGFGLDEAAMRERLAATGFDLARIDLVPPTAGIAEHLATYARVDVALDPFPYGGTTTTCEALWMGVPVVTLAGDRHAARVGTSLVTAVGHPEWSAASTDDYLGIAARLAADPATLATLRASLRQRMAASPLLDHAGQAVRFGEAVLGCVSEVVGAAVNSGS